MWLPVVLLRMTAYFVISTSFLLQPICAGSHSSTSTPHASPGDGTAGISDNPMPGLFTAEPATTLTSDTTVNLSDPPVATLSPARSTPDLTTTPDLTSGRLTSMSLKRKCSSWHQLAGEAPESEVLEAATMMTECECVGLCRV